MAGGFTGTEGLREGPVSESTAPLGDFAGPFPDFFPTFLLQVETEALREGTLAEFARPAAPAEATTALLEGTFPLFTAPVATRMPPVAIIYPPPL